MHFYSFTAATIFFVTLQISVTGHILLHKEDVSSAIGWMGLVWLAPIVGSILYILFGINRIRRKASRLYAISHQHTTPVTKHTTAEHTLPPSLAQLMRLGHKTHPQHFSIGNRIHALINGDQAYPRMCQVIANASKEVLIASYIFNNDPAGQQFVSALKQAAGRGAKVRVLIDGVGVNYSRPNILHALKSIPEVECGVFLPSKHPFTLPFVNLRNHRKIMIIDGKTAFFGGMNIAQGNVLAQQPKEPIQDVTFEVQGPVLAQMARVFEQDWNFATGKSFQAFLPADLTAPLSAKVLSRIVPDGPDADYGKVAQICLGAISCAQQKIRLVTPYFLPENEILSALQTAALRGVHIEIILPKRSNIFGMDLAMQANFTRLLKSGIHLYRSQAPFDHSKLFTIDGQWVFVGSANWDVRSFKLNFESNMECFSKSLAQEIERIIDAKKAKSEPVLLNKSYPLYRRLLENAWRLCTPYY